MEKNLFANGFIDRYYLKKLLRVMRITIFLMLLSVFIVQANSGKSQTTKLTFTFKNASLIDVFDEIEQKAQIGFLIPSNMIDENQRVTASFKDVSVDYILNKILSDKNYSYEFIGKNVIISRIENESNVQQDKKVRGKVSDTNGDPIPGASVFIKGSSTGTITDVDGNFQLTDVPTDAIIQISFIGMKTQEIALKGQSSINVVLAEETIGIDEVVAIGYGTQRKVRSHQCNCQYKNQKISLKVKSRRSRTGKRKDCRS
jgi:hypothetical protein